MNSQNEWVLTEYLFGFVGLILVYNNNGQKCW